MPNKEETQLREQDLSTAELVDQEPLEAIKDSSDRLAGNNQISDFGDDTKGTLQETDNQNSDE